MNSGQKLYALYVEKMEAAQSDPFDQWDDLNPVVQRAWEDMAVKISLHARPRSGVCEAVNCQCSCHKEGRV